MAFWESFSPERIGFAIAALAYLALSLLVLTTRSRNVPKSLLLAFILSSFVWALFYAIQDTLPYNSAVSHTLEVLRQLLLLLFLLAALRPHKTIKDFIFKNYSLLIIGVLFGWLAACLWLQLSASLLYTGYLGLCVLALALLEALYRRSGSSERWQFKPLLIALATGIVFDFVLLAESALFARIDTQLWQARGFVFALLVPVLTISIRRIEAWGINVYISRDIVLQSSLVLAAGLYLCLLAITGFYLRYFGGSWSELLQTSFIVLGFALLLLLVLSGTLRRRIKVFIEKHFFANRFDYREQWLTLTSGLKQIDISHHDRHQKLLRVWLASINYTQGAIVQYRAQGELKTLALQQRNALTDAEQTLLQRYFTLYANQNWQVDLREPQGKLTEGLAPESLQLQLILPIRTKDGLWGVCIMQTDSDTKLRLNWELRDYLSLVSEQVTALLLLMQHSDKLSENAQFIAFSRMSAFVVHDLKNVKAQLDLLLRNAQKHKHNPEFIDDSFITLEAMQQRLDHMLLQLTNKHSKEQPQRSFSVGKVLTQVINERCSGKLPVPQVDIINDSELKLDQDRFANVMFHLLDNAQHATPSNGMIKLVLNRQANHLHITLEDSGSGMSADFIEKRLFKPFDTTKGNAGMGIGVYDAQVFIEQAGGTIQVTSTLGKGTTFSIQLPLHSEPLLEPTRALLAQGL
ncbi:XrtA/PEP-CTERM system histidine kinase PrsK [Rheinheimera sp. UJ63]|uniref:XrtA/PEP-CTERM system histidine kinase PrsK n=1 Tax=Rheinheimera sp. UJ63 TaxID=2910157 RepID=UPI001F177EC0|nr:XrtA/PEP-CTERM system histidine kinase PrsK [Rheinheimera sp. UJ63]MCF4007820.1 PEP-CTERM system histidine kinase PrsK [Rheinheimera sp. UJ63]